MPGIQVVGGASGVTAEVETNTRAMRVSQRPLDPLTLGSYCVHWQSGIMAAGAAANSPIFAFRWGDATRLAVLRAVRFGMSQGTVQFATGVATVGAIICRAFSASATGGQAADMSGNFGKKRTSFGTSLVTDIRGSQTAVLTSGTRTPDSMHFGGVTAIVGNTPGLATLYSGIATGYVIIPAQTPLWTRDTGDEYPYVFAQNEGFEVRCTVPATGTWFFTTTIEWTEVASFSLLLSLCGLAAKLLATLSS